MVQYMGVLPRGGSGDQGGNLQVVVPGNTKAYETFVANLPTNNRNLHTERFGETIYLRDFEAV